LRFFLKFNYPSACLQSRYARK